METQIEQFKIEKEDHINCVIREGPTKLKISSVFTSTDTEPFINSNTNDKLETDEVVAKTTTSRHSGLIIRTISQINKPLVMVANKTPESKKPIMITRVGNTTVKPVRRIVSQSSNQQPIISYPPIKFIPNPKGTSITQVSSDYLKKLQHENAWLRTLLEDVRQESIEVQHKMASMQTKIDNILRIRKPEVPKTERSLLSEIKTIPIPSIPSFSITEISTFLKFEKDLAHKQFFFIVFHRVLKTCKFYLSNNDVLNTCLRVLISSDILTHFEWNSNNNELHSLSKCMNFINLFYKLTVSITEYSTNKFTQLQICDFLRVELKKEPKVRKIFVQMSKFPRLSTGQLCYVNKSSALKNFPPTTNRVLVHKIKQRTASSPVPTTSTSSIGIDESDLFQNEITSTEIDLNIIKTSEENDNALNGDEDDIEMQVPTIDDNYKEPEIDAPTINFNFDTSVTSIKERNADETESGFEIVNCSKY